MVVLVVHRDYFIELKMLKFNVKFVSHNKTCGRQLLDDCASVHMSFTTRAVAEIFGDHNP